MVWTGDARGHLALSLVSLVAEVDARWPGRDDTSDGSIGDVAHLARASDHNIDEHRVVRAVDIDDNDPTAAAEGIGRTIAETIRTRKPAWVKYLIYHGQICSAYPAHGAQPWQWRPYFGINAHRMHVHVSVNTLPAADRPQDWGVYEEDDDVLDRATLNQLDHIDDRASLAHNYSKKALLNTRAILRALAADRGLDEAALARELAEANRAVLVETLRDHLAGLAAAHDEAQVAAKLDAILAELAEDDEPEPTG